MKLHQIFTPAFGIPKLILIGVFKCDPWLCHIQYQFSYSNVLAPLFSTGVCDHTSANVSFTVSAFIYQRFSNTNTYFNDTSINQEDVVIECRRVASFQLITDIGQPRECLRIAYQLSRRFSLIENTTYLSADYYDVYILDYIISAQLFQRDMYSFIYQEIYSTPVIYILKLHNINVACQDDFTK